MDQVAGKVLVSGGGKCNFTNLNIEAGNYISENPHFCKSALSRYTQWDFIAALEEAGIPWEEREHGELFTTESAREIQKMLLDNARSAGAALKTGVRVGPVEKRSDAAFRVRGGSRDFSAESLVIATGGLSLPETGAGPFGYRIAEQFGIPVTKLSPGLVPLTLSGKDKERFGPLSGIAVDAEVSAGGKSFRENLLFTHRGLSGPVILQISNYLQPGEELSINLLPGENLESEIENFPGTVSGIRVQNLLFRYLPRRLVAAILSPELAGKSLKALTPVDIRKLSESIHQWKIKPAGTGGYRTAEVTRGGVSTEAVSSKTFETDTVPGLFFIGEVLDVTGWLGGYNLQWAWSSGWCAGQFA
jgi:predicted Rossmann fold flavoprotein